MRTQHDEEAEQTEQPEHIDQAEHTEQPEKTEKTKQAKKIHSKHERLDFHVNRKIWIDIFLKFKLSSQLILNFSS